MAGETKSDLTKRKIIEAVIESVARNGFEFSTATTISKQANLNRGLIVHYFSTIEKLIKETTREAGLFVIHRTNELMLEHAEIEDPIERYFKATYGWIKERPHYGQFILSLIPRAAYNKKSRDPVMLVFSSGRTRIGKLLDEGIKKGLYDCKSTEKTALELHAMLVGNLMNFLINPKDLEISLQTALSTAAVIVKKKTKK